MKYFYLFITVLLASGSVAAQNSGGLYLNVTIPEADTTYTNFSVYRVSAGTHPDARAFINGEEVKVYENGAFAKLFQLSADDTVGIKFRVELGSEKLEKDMVFIRPEPVNETPDKPMIITDNMVLPEDDIWLKAGDVLEVRFLGSPGEKAVFNIDGFKRNIPMRELPADLANGKQGVYTGRYEIMPGDFVQNTNITFKMKRNFLGYKKRKTKTVVSFNGLPRTGEVIDERPFLNVGLGTDRLGGAKYGYLEKGVRLKITGRQLGMYRVELTPALSAWIPVSQVKLLPEGTRLPESLTGNIRITGNSVEDLITLDLGDKLPFTTTQRLNPNEILVNVYGATSNTNWKTRHLSAEGIEEVDWQQVDDHWFQLRIKLKHKQNWGYSAGYGWGSQLNIKVRRAPKITDETQPLKGMIIAVDAGHGGAANGSLGSTGLMEKDVALEITQKLQNQLQQKGAEVILTRTDDREVLMIDRYKTVLNSRASMLVSIHANSIGYTSDPFRTHGTATFYKHIAFKPLAELMYHKMLGLGLEQYGITGSFNFSLNGPVEFPNVLVETAFMSYPPEEILLADEEFQRNIAKKITEGLEEYFLNYADTDSMQKAAEKMEHSVPGGP